MTPGLQTHSDALASVYARSLFELADSKGGQGAIEELAAEFDAIVEIAKGQPKFVEFLRSEILGADVREGALRNIFSGRVSELMLNTLFVLNRKGRLAHIGAVAASFDELLQERFGRIEVDVFTAIPAERKQLDEISKRLQAAIGKEPVIHAYTDPQMIGGLRLKVGDQLVDGSVSTRLRRIREELATSGASTIRTRAGNLFDESN